MQCILGIDSGGSKCEALVAGPDGTAFGWGAFRCGDVFLPPSMMGSGRSQAAVLHAVESAMAGVECDELRVVFSLPSLPVWPSLRKSGMRLTLHTVGEYAGALNLSGVRSGIVALVGTGALVHGVAPDGRALTLDGMGPMLGDFGSGYQIGQLAIRTALKASWHVRHQTSMASDIWETLRRYSGYGERFSAVEYLHSPRDRAEIASLAETVDRHARAGDGQAVRILQEAADAFAETVRDVIAALGMDSLRPCRLAARGSVITRSDVYWSRFVERVNGFAPNIEPRRLTVPPVAGYILEYAEQRDAEGLEPGFRRRLLRSTAAVAGRPVVLPKNAVPSWYRSDRATPWKVKPEDLPDGSVASSRPHSVPAAKEGPR